MVKDEEKAEEDEWEAVKMGEAGRIVVPKEYLKKKGLKKGDIVLLSLKKAKVEVNERRD